jgi:hypothetical protein
LIAAVQRAHSKMWFAHVVRSRQALNAPSEKNEWDGERKRATSGACELCKNVTMDACDKISSLEWRVRVWI